MLFDRCVLTQIATCTKLCCEPAYHPVCGKRPWNALVYFLEGDSIYQFGDTTVTTHAGSLLWLPQGSRYSIRRLNGNVCIYFDFGTAQELNIAPFARRYNDSQSIAELFSRGVKVFQQHKVGSEMELLGLLYQVISQIQYLESMDYLPNTQLKRLESSVEYIRNHCCDSDVRVADLARIAGVSTRYYSRLFSAYYGMPPKEYILRLQIDRAKELLTGTSRPVTQIALDSGFGDVYYFSRVFRKRTGFSPGGYRKEGNFP